MDEIRVVKKKVKVSSKLTDSDHELPREGRHLGILAPLADIYLKMQCSVIQCQASQSTAQICCNRNFNLNCCYFIQSLLYPSPPAVPLWSSSKPLLPFSLGLSLELTEHQIPQQSSLTYYPPYHQEVPIFHEHHHQEVPIYHEDHHQEVPIYHEHHHQKPGVCPQPDRDYYNRPGYHQDYYDDIPKVPGYNSPNYGSCSYDEDCPRSQKCCHLKIGQHQIVMLCRYPADEPWNGPWRTNRLFDD